MFLVHQTRDFDELREAQIGWDLFYRLLSRGEFRSSLWIEFGAGIQFDYEFWNQSVEIQGGSHSTSFSFIFSACRDRSFFINGQNVNGRSLVVLPPGIEIHAVTGAVGALCSICLDITALNGLGEDCIESLSQAQNRRQLMIYPDRSLGELRGIFKAMTAKSTPQGSIARHWSAARVKRAIGRVLQIKEYEYSPAPKKIYRIAKQSRDCMISDLRSSMSIIDICQEVGASERSVHYAFKSVFGTTPKAFMKLQRMMAARKALLIAEENEQIGSIMIDYGFVDAGHFAKDYRNQFGELPSETIQRYR